MSNSEITWQSYVDAVESRRFGRIKYGVSEFFS